LFCWTGRPSTLCGFVVATVSIHLCLPYLLFLI
jgi:hypothetical protein